MKISVIQMNMKAGDTEYNYSLARNLLIKAASSSPDVIVLPEMWNTGFFPRENITEYADKNGEITKALLKEISREYNVNIVGGSVTEEREDGIYNTCYIFDNKGTNIASYSKIHLFSPMGENEYFTAGDSLCVFDICGVKAAVIICYDIRFPELVRRLALSGAELLFVPSQWPAERIEQLEILMRGRAVENQMFTVNSNSCGVFGETSFGGKSIAVNPYGKVIAAASSSEEILTFTVGTDEVKSIRNAIPVFSDRRQELYI